jgi:hypothetical protein
VKLGVNWLIKLVQGRLHTIVRLIYKKPGHQLAITTNLGHLPENVKLIISLLDESRRVRFGQLYFRLPRYHYHEVALGQVFAEFEDVVEVQLDGRLGRIVGPESVENEWRLRVLELVFEEFKVEKRRHLVLLVLLLELGDQTLSDELEVERVGSVYRIAQIV